MKKISVFKDEFLLQSSNEVWLKKNTEAMIKKKSGIYYPTKVEIVKKMNVEIHIR